MTLQHYAQLSEYMDRKEFCACAGLSRSVVDVLRQEGRLKVLKLRRRHKFHKSNLVTLGVVMVSPTQGREDST